MEVRRIEVTGELIGMSLREADIRQRYGVNVIAIEREHHNPGGLPPRTNRLSGRETW